MRNWDLDQVIPLVLEGGRMAISYFDSPLKEFKADESIVTIADRSIENFLANKLDHPDQGSYLLGEETIDGKSEEYLAEAFRQVAWVIDPIDGTAPFSNNLPNWGVSVGFMDRGVLKEGMIFLAALGELYYTNSGRVFREKLGTDPDQWLSRTGLPVQLKKPASADIPRGIMVAISQQMARSGAYRLPFYIQVTGSTVYNMTKLAAGSFGALITKFKLWDFAAGLPILAALGWTMEYLSIPGGMTLTMDEKNICLDKNSPDRWSAHDHVIFAPSTQAAAYVRENLKL